VALVTLEEFKSSKYYSENFTDEQVQYALSYAEERFYVLTNREKHGYWMESRELTLELDGTGHRLLRSPYPVLGVAGVTIIGEDGSQEDVTSSVRARGHFLWYKDGWPYGFANVRVQGTFGDPRYAGKSVPDDVKEAVMRLAWRKLRRDRIAGERNFERRAPGPTEPIPPPTLTGDREVDGIIRSYMIEDLSSALDIRGPYEDEGVGQD